MESSTKVVIGIGAGLGLLYLLSRKSQAPVTPTNLLSNPGFEEGSVSWSSAQTGTNALFGAESDGAGGNVLSIAYPTNTGTEVASVNQEIPVTEGKQYKVGGLLKTVNIITIPPNGAGIVLIPKDSLGNILGAIPVAAFLTGTQNWILVEKILTAPVGAASVVISLQLMKSTGKVSFDNMYMNEIV